MSDKQKPTRRAGRLYSISSESRELVRKTYEEHWLQIKAEVEKLKSQGETKLRTLKE